MSELSQLSHLMSELSHLLQLKSDCSMNSSREIGLKELKTFQVVIRSATLCASHTRRRLSVCDCAVVVCACSAFRALLQIRAMRKKLSPLSPGSFNPVITSQTSDSEDNSVPHTQTHARTHTHTHNHTLIDTELYISHKNVLSIHYCVSMNTIQCVYVKSY